ncbi:hypothetical protein [Gloeothece verrucosa]|uniref:Uncharacterized protein n=1 Tax=Gloeothece verrucosa (strain PCC 7822) TaxID=497965 RepID=E0UK83_GLOV7|nr:hypothetical protein [Gloeothece verrucosa]ADN15845.1 conserved hypothetical protein [Gloeothece verrucosa PCC 7822]
MSIRLFALATLCTATLAAAFPLLTQDTVVADISLNKQQTQETSISLNSEDLKSPHLLIINASVQSTRLRGYIELDGKRLLNFDRDGIEINLSPSLKPGQHKLKILGQYEPADASVTVRFEGINTEISQQVSGNGSLNQTIIIDVR